MTQTKRHSLKDPKSGKFKRAPGKLTSVERWNQKGYLGLKNWIEDNEPHILNSSNQYEKFTPTKKQTDILKKILKVDELGNFILNMILLIWPRRHSKSTIFALICLWLLTSRENYCIQVLGNSEVHSRRVQFNLLIKIIQHSPKLSKIISEKSIKGFEIHCKSTGSVIQMQTGVNIATAFGSKSNVIWVSDFHACPDLGPWNAMQASLLDSEGSITLIDSNVDATDQHVHEIQKSAERDETTFCDHIQYTDFNEYSEKAPIWLDRIKAKKLARTTLPTDFARDILGKRLDARNALFPEEIRKLCRVDYKIPIADLSALTQGRNFKIGAALDRAKSLSPAFGSDSTVLSVVLKCASPEHGEAMFTLLDMTVFPFNTSKLIKKAILKAHEAYHIDNLVLENYEITDLAPWLSDMKIPYEIVSATDTAQNSAFPEMYRIFSESRFNYPKDLKRFDSELSTFVYTQRKGGRGYSFGHVSQKFHDDTVYATAWAIYSLRTAIMNLYVLGSFYCKNKSKRRHMCFLMGGNLELLCKESCQAYGEVEAMFREFKQHQFDSELTLPEFYFEKVRHIGARISQAA